MKVTKMFKIQYHRWIRHYRIQTIVRTLKWEIWQSQMIQKNSFYCFEKKNSKQNISIFYAEHFYFNALDHNFILYHTFGL